MKNLQIAELFEVYKNLFTEKQKQILTEYYVYDLSLGEIAENNNVSRQAVNDTIKNAKSN